MRIRFRPRIGPFVIESSPPRTEPVTRGEDLAGVVLVLSGALLTGLAILACVFGPSVLDGMVAVAREIAARS